MRSRGRIGMMVMRRVLRIIAHSLAALGQRFAHAL
jgi:hypothetical protein